MAILTNVISFILFNSICSSLGNEIQLTLNDEMIKSLDSHPLIRKERQFNHGSMMNNPYSDHLGMMNNGQDLFGQPNMNLMGLNHGYQGNTHHGDISSGFQNGMMPGVNEGLYNPLLNSLNMMKNLMGSGRSAQNFQKEMIAPLSTDPLVHRGNVADNMPLYPTNIYPGGCSCMRAATKSSEPVVSYILSAPYRRQNWLI